MTDRFRIALALAAFWGLSGCARVIAPEGGPKDLVAPVLVRVVPDSGATKVPLREPLVLEFSEWIDPATVRSAVSLMPAPARAPEILVDGPRVTVRLREPLDSGSTSVLRLGAGIADFRGAASGAAREIPFTTGQALDSGSLALRAWIADDSSAPKPAGARVGLYALDSSRRAGLAKLLRRRDSTRWLAGPPSPWREKPWRWAQTDSNGIARLGHLGPGRWRVVAWEDLDKDGYWRPGEERISWAGDLVWTGASGRDTLLARLSRLDTLEVTDSVKPLADSSRARQRPRRKSDSLGFDAAQALVARKLEDSLARRRDSLAARDSSRLDSLEARERALPDDSVRMLEVSGLPEGWTSRPGLRVHLWRLDEKRRRIDLKPEPGVVRIRVPRGGRWSGEAWIDEDGDGAVATGDPFRLEAAEPWRPLSVLSDDPSDESAVLRLVAEPFLPGEVSP